jgi:quercetin dioxygenase-like cupin family protein
VPYEEARRYQQGSGSATFYRDALEQAKRERERRASLPDVIRADEMPWEDSPHGRLKHLVNEGMDTKLNVLDVYLQELPPGGRSGQHRHWSEEYIYVLEGRGRDLHWDVAAEVGDQYEWRWDDEPSEHEWAEGDVVMIPPNTIHQHFNTDTAHPARFISATNRLYKRVGYPDLEQLEDAPRD